MTTERARSKADRRAAILREAARLFADRGFAGVSIEDLGAAVGVRGPAVYKHFTGKQAVLAAILLGASEQLLTGGRAVIERTGDHDPLAALVAFHVDFALRDADVIRVQDRDLASLDDDARKRVRRLQREYVELWVDVLAGIHPAATPPELRVRAHAVFGLINSTPHSVRGLRPAPSDASVRRILQSLAGAALRA
jgi:AcrR family transcriptional regulator